MTMIHISVLPHGGNQVYNVMQAKKKKSETKKGKTCRFVNFNLHVCLLK